MSGPDKSQQSPPLACLSARLRPAAFIEQLGDGWHVIVGNKDCGTMLESAALELAEKINAGGGDGDK